MKYSIYPQTNIQSIPLDAKKIHLVRPIKLKKLDSLLKKRKIEEISLSDSCFNRLSKKAKQFLNGKEITLKTDNRSGRAIELSFDQILKITEFRKDYLSVRKIEGFTGIPKSTIHYLLKYGNRNKLRKGKQTIYLE